MKLNDVRLKSKSLCQSGRFKAEKLLAMVIRSSE